MNYIIENDKLKIEVKSLGAELNSIQFREREYLWQGDNQYWNESSPILFPFIGRFFESKYTYQDKSYEMSLHGFAGSKEFTLIHHDQDRLTLAIEADEGTRIIYPFEFRFSVSYLLNGSSLEIRYKVENLDKKTMYFALGGHPGINLPMEDHLRFEDYYLQFNSGDKIQRVLFGENKLVEKKVNFDLHEGYLQLEHQLFDNDAILLEDSGHYLEIKSNQGNQKIKIEYPDFSYIGFWQPSKTKAPFLCIEPWTSLPGREKVIESLEDKQDLECLKEKEIKNFHWNIYFE